MPAKSTIEQFIEKSNKIHNNFYTYFKVDYKNAKTKVTITCPIHGDFEQMPTNHLQGQRCPKCFGGIKKTTEQFIEKANKLHNNFYDYSKVDYKNARTKVTITCPVHGDFEQTPFSHLGGSGCLKCYIQNKTKTTQQFIKQANKLHNNFYTYPRTDYKNSYTPVTITCPIHGDFEQTPYSHLGGKGCPNCSNVVSKKETAWLDYLGIPNNKEHRQVHIKLHNDKKIVVDGYDPQTNTIYEFHGDYWHGNPKIHNLNEINRVNKKTFGQLLEKTQKRSRAITSSGYNLVSIWESDWEEMQKEIAAK